MAAFDVLVVTAPREAQAAAYAEELSRRSLPCQAVAVADPGGRRVGSGGGTLNALRAAADLCGGSLAGQRVAVIHSGGDSQRSPTQSLCGKAWSMLNAAGGAAPIDLLLDLLGAYFAGLPAGGCVVASSDVMLRLPGRCDCSRAGVTGVAIAADARYGPKHGVFALDAGDGALRSYLQKPPADALPLLPDGRVAIDSGVLMFDAATTQTLLALSGPLLAARDPPPRVELYSDMLLALSGSGLDRAAYLALPSDAPADVREQLWAALSGVALHAALPAGAAFAHLGTTAELVGLMQGALPEFAEAYALQRRVRAWGADPGPDVVVANSVVGAGAAVGAGSVVEHSRLAGLSVGAGCFVSGLRVSGGDAALPDGMALQQIGDTFVVFGLRDDVKAATTLCHRPWPVEEGLWADDEPHTLWHARLFGRDLGAALALARGDVAAWRAQPGPLVSLHSLMRSASAPGEFAWRRALSAVASVAADSDAPVLPVAADHSSSLLRELAADPATPLPVAARALALAGLEAESAAVTARCVATAAPATGTGRDDPLPAGVVATARAPARLDLAGGWSDTPPLTCDRGGAVVNVAVRVRGQKPIGAEAERLADPDAPLRLESRSEGATAEGGWDGGGKIDPRQPCALLRAACAFAGVRSGMRVACWAELPQGSGLGTSSILAGCVVAALWRVQGVAADPGALSHAVLCVEQLLTTGGGWQDQVGGLFGGAKLATSAPGLPLRVAVQPLPAAALRFVLVYSGRPRLARDLLQQVVRRWHAREPAVVAARAALVQGAHECARALEAGDADAVGRCLSRYWALKQEMAGPGCLPDALRGALDALRPHCAGLSLAGAGGGGFIVALTALAAEEVGELVPGLEVYEASVCSEGLSVCVSSS